MAATLCNRVLDRVRTPAVLLTETTDSDLLARFIQHGDEAAFEMLVRRHGPMILGVCRRILHNDSDAEDAFQATFLVLVRKARTIHRSEGLANWLYGVAHNTALKARAMKRQRSEKERLARRPDLSADTLDRDPQLEQLLTHLDTELRLLPDHYRLPIVLCDLEGQTIQQAASTLGCPVGTVASRLARGRALLARRLSRHGLALSAGSLATALSARASKSLHSSLIAAALHSSQSLAGGVSLSTGTIKASVATLAEGVLKMMLLKKLAKGSLSLLAVVACTAALVATFQFEAAPRAAATAPVPVKPSMVFPGDEAFSGRAGEAKARLLKEFGGNEQSELAVARGLAWLALQQKKDGSWAFAGGDSHDTTAATGMALLAFLGAGETHKSETKYRETVKKGLKWLLTQMMDQEENAGRFKDITNMYSQAIATLALCEAYGTTGDKELLAPAQSAIDYIQRSQAANGSWGYTSSVRGDTSITGWQIQALHAARLCQKLSVKKDTIKKTVGYLDFAASGSNKAMYGYVSNMLAAAGTALTAEGLLGRYCLDGWRADNAGFAEGVAGLMKRAPGSDAQKTPLDLYFYFHATQVVRYFGGDEWKTWNEGPKKGDGTRSGGMRDYLIELQITKEGDDRGSWDPDRLILGRSCGRLGTTAMCLLTLEVYYRYLPLNKLGVEAKPGK